jgi:hypothetical protein
MKLLSLPTVLLLCATAQGQSTIYGMDVRLQRFFTTDTGAYVANFTSIASNSSPVFALDFDATATTLWGVENTLLEYGTFDLTTGVFSSLGSVPGILGATGLTASSDGTTWYLSEYDAGAAATKLWVGDVTTGSFSLVGTIEPGIVIDISIDSQDNLYGHSISTDTLLSIDTTTGAGTTIGPTGQAANFAQGMDFDWSTDTLYASVYTGGGTGVFAQMDLTTGAAVVLDITTPLNSEMEIAIQEPAPGPGILGTSYCVSTPNSTGGAAIITATGSDSVAAQNVTLTATPVPNQPGIFYFGPNQIQIAFGNGFRCVGGTTVRLAPNTASGNVLTRVLDFNSAPVMGTIVGNTTWNFQAWYRDPAGGGAGFNLSDAVEIPFLP